MNVDPVGAVREPPLHRFLKLWFERGKFPAVDGLLQEFLGLIGPELGNVGIGIDHRILELPADSFYLADINVLDWISIGVQAHGPTGNVRELYLSQSLH